ncbi:MAG: hypothetical protein ACK5ZC_08585 [Pirellulaceae bacterium]|jgi:hypothetical protein
MILLRQEVRFFDPSKGGSGALLASPSISISTHFHFNHASTENQFLPKVGQIYPARMPIGMTAASLNGGRIGTDRASFVGYVDDPSR